MESTVSKSTKSVKKKRRWTHKRGMSKIWRRMTQVDQQPCSFRRASLWLLRPCPSMQPRESEVRQPHPRCRRGRWRGSRDEIGKPLNRFILLHLNTKTKAKAVKLDMKTNTNFLENFKNKLIRVELCRTRLVYGILTCWTKCIIFNKWIIIKKSYNFLKKYLHSTPCKEDMIFQYTAETLFNFFNILKISNEKTKN